MNLILASKSPRRAAILKSRGLSFEVLEVDTEEVSTEVNPQKFCENIADEKYQTAISILEEEGRSDPAVVIASDTIVVYQNKIFGKPTCKDNAREMLIELSGDCHEVITSVCLGFYGGKKFFKKIFSEKTKIYFLELDKETIEYYLKTQYYEDKAGAYGIQGDQCFFVSKIEGSLSNVIGLPIESLTQELKNLIQLNNEENMSIQDYFRCN